MVVGSKTALMVIQSDCGQDARRVVCARVYSVNSCTVTHNFNNTSTCTRLTITVSFTWFLNDVGRSYAAPMVTEVRNLHSADDGISLASDHEVVNIIFIALSTAGDLHLRVPIRLCFAVQ